MEGPYGVRLITSVVTNVFFIYFYQTVVIEEDDILPVMEDEFPHLYLSPVTAKMMWQKQMRQISHLTKAAHLRKPTKVQKQIEEASRKQERLMTIMKKELEHNKRLVRSTQIYKSL